LKEVDRIGRRITLRDLNIFLAVADKHSMSKAAHQLAVSQPVVSKAIAHMERVFRVPLLDRNPRGVEPTLYGRALVKRSAAVFDELRQSVRDIEFLADPTAGEARIGGTPPLVAGIVPAVAASLARRYPRVLIDVLEGDLSALLAALGDRQIDLVIGRAPEPIADEEIDSELLFDDRLLVVAGTRSKWAKRHKIALSELIHEPWVFPSPNTVAAPLVSEVFRASGLKPPRATVASSSMAMNIHVVTAGDFLALLPASTVLFSAHQPFKALPVALPDRPRPVIVATSKNRELNPVAGLFLDNVRALIRSSALTKVHKAR
jgi:DNA-binding transcriptional LysR family regulator